MRPPRSWVTPVPPWGAFRRAPTGTSAACERLPFMGLTPWVSATVLGSRPICLVAPCRSQPARPGWAVLSCLNSSLLTSHHILLSLQLTLKEWFLCMFCFWLPWYEWAGLIINCILLENITVLEKYIGFNLSGICLHESRLPLPLVFSYRRDDGHACRQMQPWAHSHLQEDCWPEWCFGTYDYTLVRVKVTVCVVFLHTLTRTPAHPQRDNMYN